MDRGDDVTVPKRILVVDDEPDTVELIHLTLSTAGYQIDSAMSALEARRKLEANHFDVLLLDVMMPEVSGFDLLTQLRESGLKVPPVVFLTARKTPEDRETGEDLGAVGYLTKPATRGDLLDAIDLAVG
jgi:DNA-binding response OmpR family regulator